jgi:hypothetical protein
MRFNAWILNDSLDEIARHCFGQFLAANQHVDLANCLCQEDCRLTGRVAAANYDDLLACAQLCFHGCGGVVDVLSLEWPQIFNFRLIVLSAGSNNNASRVDATAIFQTKLVRPLVAPDLHWQTTRERKKPNSGDLQKLSAKRPNQSLAFFQNYGAVTSYSQEAYGGHFNQP